MKRNKIRIRILKAITAAACVGFFVSAAAVDSKSNTPIIVCAVCIAWIALMAAANMEGR